METPKQLPITSGRKFKFSFNSKCKKSWYIYVWTEGGGGVVEVDGLLLTMYYGIGSEPVCVCVCLCTLSCLHMPQELNCKSNSSFI